MLSWASRHPVLANLSLGVLLTGFLKHLGLDFIFGSINAWLGQKWTDLFGPPGAAVSGLIPYIGPAIGAALIIVLVFYLARAGGRHERKGAPMSLPVLGMMVFGAGFAGCLILWLISGVSKPAAGITDVAGPIEWTFSSGGHYFLSAELTDNGDVRITGFQASGQNTSDSFIRGLDGNVESGATGKTFRLGLLRDNEWVPLSDNGIPAGHQFHVKAPFGEQIPVARFLSEYGTLMMRFQYSGDAYTRTFSFDEVAAEAERIEQDLKPKPKPTRYGPSQEGSNSYATQLRHAAIGYRDGIVVGRLKATNDRCASQQWDRLVSIMPEQRLHSDDLMNADKSKLTPRQVELVTAYQLRETELENYVKAVEARRYSGAQAARSFRHRVQQLANRLDALIQDWES